MTECEDCEERDARIAELEAKVKKLRDALEFYAPQVRYEWSSNEGLLGQSLISEGGFLARQALKETGDGV